MVSPLVTRRNGKTQACEPCRRRKVACDHGYPVCRRCLKRPNGESTCYYASPDQDARSAELTVSRQAVHDTSTLGSKSTAVSSQANRHVGPEDRIWSSPAARAPRGFFGPTSLSAAYLETESSLAARGPSPIVPASPTKPTAPSPADIQNMVNLDLSANNLAIRALQAIPEEPAMSLYRSHTNPNDEWMGRISERLVISTWETFGSYLRDRENVAKLRELGSMICINTRRTLREDQDDPEAWIESFSGPNLRWEAVGMMFLYIALGEFSASSGEKSLKTIGHYTEFCSSCITLANMGGSSGSLMLFLLYKRSVLHACMYGETSLPYWKFHAETVAMLTFSGFHDNRSKESFSASSESVSMEARRRIGCQIFIVDKFLATFVGRPPLLTRRFFSMSLPLDLDDTALLSDKETFQGQLHRIDADGWDMDGRFHSSSLLRVRMMVALIRDEILEVVLDQSGNNALDDILVLKSKELELYQRLPAHIVYSPIGEDIDNIDLQVVYPKLLIRLDHLLNVFLVERILVKHGRPRNDLLRTSFEMVVLTLQFWTQKHIWAEIQGESRWIIMGHATLAGAVLCMELIDPNPVSISTDTEEKIAGESYSRSSIIQQLSLLVGYLNSWSPSQPSSSVASNVRGVIKKVLDYLLNDPRGPQTPIGFGFESLDFAIDWDILTPFNPMDNVDWFAERE